MTTFQEFIDTTLLPTLLNVAVVFVTVLAGMAINAIRKWGESQQMEMARNILIEAADAAERAVAFTAQTFTDNARTLDGSLDPGQAREAMSIAITATKEQLGAEGMAILARAVGGSDKVSAVLRTFVEAAVSNQKLERETAAAFLNR